MTCGESFVETATIVDDCDSAPDLVINGEVNSDVAGTYVITYTGTDASGNAALPVSRTVIVESGLPDVIVITGDAVDPGVASIATFSFPSFDGIENSTISWTYTGEGAFFADGEGTNEVEIHFSDGFTPGDLVVTVANACDQVTGTLSIQDGGCLDVLTVEAVDDFIDAYFAERTVISSALIDEARTILFQAAESIEFTPDFEVELGAVFEANIGPCLTPTILTQMLDENNGVERE